MFAQLAADIMNKSPNNGPRNAGPYVTLTAEERLAATWDIFKRPDLPFTAVRWKQSDESHWNLQFDRFFPPAGKDLGARQNFDSCNYFAMWLQVRTRLPERQVEQIRNKLRKHFNRLFWLPHTESDRMWDTR
ncbi:hypothetical protein FKP32DRAFT_1531583, partial [Trametes sanguinea]